MKIVKAERTEAGTGEITMEYAEQTFKELLAFQGYGFCLGYDVPVIEQKRGEVPIGILKVGDHVLAPGDRDGDGWERVENIIPRGNRDVYRVGFSNGKELMVTLDHPLMCSDGALRGTSDILGIYAENGNCEVMFRNLEKARISVVEYVGKMPVMDITVSGESHLFYANGCVVHNCKAHATSYSVYSAVQMWLQEHYFIEYMCALLNHIDRAKEKKGVGILNERVEYCMKYGRTILYPDVNRSGDKWVIVNNNDTLLAPLKNIKGFSDREVGIIERNRPYANLKDFLDKTKFNKNRFESLLFAHALDSFGEIEDLYNWYYNHYAEQEKQGKRPKKMEQSFLWEEDGDEQSSTVPESIRTFTKNEIEERCLDMNGFVIHENIRIKYHEFFERGMEKVAEFKKNPAYNSPKRRIYKLSEIECEEPEEDKFKNRWVLAKVTSEARDIPSKFGGKTFHKITINDGFSSVTITGNRIPRSLSKGRVMVFPVSIINGRMYIDNHAMEKLDPVVLEEGG